MEDFPLEVSNGDKYDGALRVMNQDEADLYYLMCVRHAMRRGFAQCAAEANERYNIRYWIRNFAPQSRENFLYSLFDQVVAVRIDPGLPVGVASVRATKPKGRTATRNAGRVVVFEEEI